MRKRFFAGIVAIFLASAAFAAAGPVNDALRQAFGATLGPLDSAFDSMFAAAGSPSRDTRKTVPLIDAQTGNASGAAQITGSVSGVHHVRAVMLLTSSSGGAELRAYVPVDRIESGPHFHRVYGVAVDAIATL